MNPQTKGATSNPRFTWSGTIKCPFHNERTPSCIVKDGSYHCSSCGAEGSVALLFSGPVHAKSRKVK